MRLRAAVLLCLPRRSAQPLLLPDVGLSQSDTAALDLLLCDIEILRIINHC